MSAELVPLDKPRDRLVEVQIQQPKVVADCLHQHLNGHRLAGQINMHCKVLTMFPLDIEWRPMHKRCTP